MLSLLLYDHLLYEFVMEIYYVLWQLLLVTYGETLWKLIIDLNFFLEVHQLIWVSTLCDWSCPGLFVELHLKVFRNTSGEQMAGKHWNILNKMLR